MEASTPFDRIHPGKRVKGEPYLNERLLTFLVNKGLLTTEQADKLRAEYERTGRSVRELLAEGGYVNEEQVTDALAAVYRMPVVRLYEQHIPVEVRTLVMLKLIQKSR